MLIKHQIRRHSRDIILIFFNIKICCVFSLESPHQGNSNEYTKHTFFNTERKPHKLIPNIIMSAAMGFSFV